MSKILFIKANDRPADQAVSVKMYEAFLSAYQESHPNDDIVELDLFEENIPYYGNTALTALYKKGQGMELTAEEEKYTSLVDKYLEQFLSADKIVFAFPLWNATVPAPLVTYISYLAQAGRMFNYTAEGPVGYASDKKVMLLCARGSDYSTEQMAPFEMASNYVKAAISLWGIQNPEEVAIQGHNQYPDRSQEIIANGLQATAEAAVKF